MEWRRLSRSSGEMSGGQEWKLIVDPVMVSLGSHPAGMECISGQRTEVEWLRRLFR